MNMDVNSQLTYNGKPVSLASKALGEDQGVKYQVQVGDKPVLEFNLAPGLGVDVVNPKSMQLPPPSYIQTRNSSVGFENINPDVENDYKFFTIGTQVEPLRTSLIKGKSFGIFDARFSLNANHNTIPRNLINIFSDYAFSFVEENVKPC